MSSAVKELATQLVEKRREADELEKGLKALGSEIGVLELDLHREMVKEGMTSARFEDLGVQIVAQMKKFPRVRPEDRGREDEIFAWLRDQGHGAVIREQVHPQTMKVTLRTLAESGIDMPSWFEVYEEPSVQVRRTQ